MPASVQIRQLTGADPGEAGSEDKTSGVLRFQRVDTTDETSLANAIPVPLTGQNYSMRVVLQMHIASGTFDQISNPRWYSDGANNFGTGRKLWYQMVDGDDYVVPSIPTEANDPPQFPGSTPMLDWFTATSGSPADGDAFNVGPFNSSGLPKYVGDLLNLVFEVEATSSQGITPSETITLSWDEI